MRLRNLYLILCVIGTVIPYRHLAKFLMDNGLNFGLFFRQIDASQISLFFTSDVLVSAVVLIVFIFADGKRNKIRHLWMPIVAIFMVGVSLGLPLYLYLRQLALDKNEIRSNVNKAC